MRSYTDDEIGRACGPDAAIYARNKERGGLSSKRGFLFELACAAYALTVQLDHLAVGGADVLIYDQVGGFVDDLAVETGQHALLSQLKSGPVSWGSGHGSLTQDFRLQMRLDQAVGRSRSYELVVSSDWKATGLREQRPQSIESVEVRTVVFTGPDLTSFIEDNPELITCLENLSSPEATPTTIANAFKLIVGLVACEPKPISTEAAHRDLSRLEEAPFAGVGRESSFDTDVKELLDSLPDFTMILKGARIYYRFGEIEGVAVWLNGSRQYGLFRDWVRQELPTGYEGAWEVLGMLRQEH